MTSLPAAGRLSIVREPAGPNVWGRQVAQVGTAAVIAILVGILVAANRTPARTADTWNDVEQTLSAVTGVASVSYDEVDDFLVVTVGDDMKASQASSLGCRRVLPAIERVSAATLFAIYSDSGRLLATWQSCEQS